MKKFKGTEGTWFRSGDYVDSINNDVIARGQGCFNTDEEEANLKLIAAAPELLEFAMEMVKRYSNSPWIYEQGNKAISKALD